MLPPRFSQNGVTARTTLSPASFFQCSTASFFVPSDAACIAAASPRSEASERLWKMYFDTPTSELDTPPPFTSRIWCWSAIGAIACVGAVNEVITSFTPWIVISRFIAETASCAFPERWSSMTASSGMPLTPPLALISSTACLMPWLMTVP